MACFIVPVAEAVVTSVTAHILESKEKKSAKKSVPYYAEKSAKVPFSRKVKWLSKLLWGGSFLLAFEHMWHGEIQPWFPFLTAAETPESAKIMFREIATVGVAMSIAVTVAWIGMLAVSNIIEKHTDEKKSLAGEKV